MRVALTGATGFLGWHTHARMLTEPDIEVVPIGRADWSRPRLAAGVSGADVVLHLAGVNRGSDEDLEAGNIALAEDLVAALLATESQAAVVYAGSSQASAHHPGRDTPYGRGKREAGGRLLDWADRVGGRATAADLRLTGLYGEHGRSNYNSFVANFAHAFARGENPTITGDRELPLIHVGDAALRILDAARERVCGVVEQDATSILISDVAAKLRYFHEVYAPVGEIPRLDTRTDVTLFNTLRAAMWPNAYPLRPAPRSDERGTLVETVRVHGGTGQAFLSTTDPGHTRGNHFHFDKVERFQVVAGTGLIRLRKVLTDETVEFLVSGDEPAVVDMPTLWSHSITNIGSDPLVTFFWTNELFDPDRPDTWALSVTDGADRPGMAAQRREAS